MSQIRRLAGNAGLMGVGLAWVTLAGTVSIPLLVRFLGSAEYGTISLFLALFGALAGFEFSRPILIQQASADEASAVAPPSVALALASTFLLTIGAWGLGTVTLPEGARSPLVVGLALHAVSGPAYARLAGLGRVGAADAIRSFCWGGAFLFASGLAWHGVGVEVVVWAFPASVGLTTFLQYSFAKAAPRRPSLKVVIRTLRIYRGEIFHLFRFSLSTGILVAAHKIFVSQWTSPDVFGQYAAQFDLGSKVGAVSTALGSLLYPEFSRWRAQKEPARASNYFLLTTAGISSVYWLGLIGLALGSNWLLPTLLGSENVTDSLVFRWTLMGVYVHLMGFLITPWQRSVKDFRTQSLVYGVASILVLVVGWLLSPAAGVIGGIVIYLTGRTAEISLVVVEGQRLSETSRVRSFLIGWALSLILLIAVAGTKG